MEQWQRIQALFERALEREPSDLAAWLEQEARDQPDIQAEVLSLLRNHQRAGSFLEEPFNPTIDLLAGEPGLQTGQQVGPYKVIREVGRGGMGRVYMAADERLHRTVALKALPPELTSDPIQRERLRREARAAAALSHPGICTVYALEEVDGEIFIASEFIEGHTLRDEISELSQKPAAEIIQAAGEISAALSAAHEKGITHRDLKPDNIMRGNDGRLKILDFGLARWGGHGSDVGISFVTAPGTILGTPAYMAPEQLGGAAIDARADVFAFGVVMYELACGVHPFAGTTSMAVAAKVLEGSIEPLESRRPDLPQAFAATINRCLRRAPADRFVSASEIVRALDGDLSPASSRTGTGWWRLHQATTIGLYAVSCVLLWQIKEWQHGSIPLALFMAVGVVATIAAMFRGHLMFTERVNRSAFQAERVRSSPMTLVADLAIGLALVADGALLAASHPVAAVCTMALGTGLGLARLVLEPSTTAASFPSSSSLR